MSSVSQKVSEERSQTIVSSTKSITLRIKRSNPTINSEEKFDEFIVPIESWTTVLDALLDVKSHLDHSIGIRYSCRQASCGSCGMKINGRPALACFTKISELDTDSITVEPMDNFPVVRDIAVNFTRLINNHKKIMPYVVSKDSEITPGEGIKESLQTPDDVEKYIQFSSCIKCGLCNSACPTMAMDTSFVGPQALAQAYRYIADTRDKGKKTRLKIIDESHGIWRCHAAGSCSQVCPKGVDPAMGIQMLRSYLLGIRD